MLQIEKDLLKTITNDLSNSTNSGFENKSVDVEEWAAYAKKMRNKIETAVAVLNMLIKGNYE